MSKEIQRGSEIYLAPDMLGKYEGKYPVVIDERNDNRELDTRNIDDKITIYEREVLEWFLLPAKELLERNSFNNSLIVLMICMSYIEGVEQYKTGISSNGKSSEFFINSINRLYPEMYQKNHLTKLYTKSRCGLFHMGMTKGGVIFNNTFEAPIGFENNGERIKINPTKLLNDILTDFTRYIFELRQSGCEEFEILRENFSRLFTVLRSE